LHVAVGSTAAFPPEMRTAVPDIEDGLELADRVAVVTGAGRGIGRAIALRLAAAGAVVVLAGRDRSALQGTADALGGAGRGLVVPTDVTSPDSVAARVDVLVNNSGVGGPAGPLWEVPVGDWEDTLRVNLTGSFLACRAFLPAMVGQRSGSVVFIGSMTGKRPLLHRAPYAASKLGLLGLCRTLALDAAPFGVRVNLVSPGFVEGPRLDWVVDKQAAARGGAVSDVRADLAAAAPLGRFVDPEDVAEAVLFLAGDRARNVTGEDLNVSAGLVMY
jgi:NAD(P)-dependent dehydrogenase (short-subunit alcohol dehydrogenase family)